MKIFYFRLLNKMSKYDKLFNELCDEHVKDAMENTRIIQKDYNHVLRSNP